MKRSPLQVSKEQLADRIDIGTRNTRTWRTLALGIAVIATVSVFGNIYQGLTSRIRVITVEVSGEKVLRVIDTSVLEDPESPALKSYLSTWITNCRTVVGDRDIQEQFYGKCMTFIKPSSPAHIMLNDYFTGNNPLERQATERVTIDVDDVFKQGELDHAYWIIWTEKVRPFAGERPTEERYRALVSFERNFLSDFDEVMTNPYGIFIKEIDWSDYYEPTS